MICPVFELIRDFTELRWPLSDQIQLSGLILVGDGYSVFSQHFRLALQRSKILNLTVQIVPLCFGELLTIIFELLLGLFDVFRILR